ncbi:MAG: hypothetical protein BJ554DRAFT_3317, partial [Olpidium bornovanus]
MCILFFFPVISALIAPAPASNDAFAQDEAWSTDTKIWIVSTRSSEWEGEIPVPVSLTKSNRGACSRPVYSPDGRWVAWLQMEVPGYENDRRRIVLYDRQAASRRYVLPKWDRSPTSIVFSPDSSEIYMTIFVATAEPGSATPWRRPRELTASGTAADLQFAPDASASAPPGARVLVYIYHDLTSPPELFTMQAGTQDARRRTFVTRKRMDDVEGLVRPQDFWFRGATKHQDIHGWVLAPETSAAAEDGKLPLAFLIHGGPQSAWMDSWSVRWNPQIFAAAGYITIGEGAR